MAERLRILHCFRAPVGGLFRHVRDLAREQARRGHSVGIVCADGGDGLTQARLAALAPDLELGVHRFAIGRLPGVSDLSAAVAVRRLARELKADIVHGHGAKGGVLARAVAIGFAGHRPKIFYTPHGGSLHLDQSSVGGRAMLVAERALERCTDGLLFECGFAAERYASVVGRPQCPSRVVANGVGVDEFGAHAPVGAATDLLFVGELRLLKGVDVLLAALAQMAGRGHLTTLTIVGDGPDAHGFRAQAHHLGVADRVSFAGVLPMAEALPRGRLLVVPSRAESFPYVVLEAAAAGVPIVATAVGGVPELFGVAAAGLVPAGDVGALACALIAKIEDPHQARREADGLRARVATAFSIDAMVTGVCGFYGEVASSAATRMSLDTPRTVRP